MLSNYSGLFHSLFWIKLKRSVGVKGLKLNVNVNIGPMRISDIMGVDTGVALGCLCNTNQFDWSGIKYHNNKFLMNVRSNIKLMCPLMTVVNKGIFCCFCIGFNVPFQHISGQFLCWTRASQTLKIRGGAGTYRRMHDG